MIFWHMLLIAYIFFLGGGGQHGMNLWGEGVELISLSKAQNEGSYASLRHC